MFNLLGKSKTRRRAAALYSTVVEQARDPRFYSQCGVADNEDGRYDMILLHMFLVLERLARAPTVDEDLKQSLFDTLFRDLDENLREMGYGDTGVRIRIQKMVEGFYGRMTAYRVGIDAVDNDQELAAALRRNLYRQRHPTDDDVQRMCRYVRRQWEAVLSQTAESLASGKLIFDDIDISQGVAS